jgi:hypothetical protein
MAHSHDPVVRLELVADPGVTPAVLSPLAGDDDAGVRLAVARHPDTALVDLQRLEQDGDAEVRVAAAERLSAALTPRAFDDSDPGSLFTPAELDALAPPSPESAGGEPSWSQPRLRTIPGGAERPARASASGVNIGDLEDVIDRLESLGQRLSSLESALSSTGEQLSAITDMLSELAGDPPQDRLPETVALAHRVLRLTGTGTDTGGASWLKQISPPGSDHQ